MRIHASVCVCVWVYCTVAIQPKETDLNSEMDRHRVLELLLCHCLVAGIACDYLTSLASSKLTKYCSEIACHCVPIQYFALAVKRPNQRNRSQVLKRPPKKERRRKTKPQLAPSDFEECPVLLQKPNKIPNCGLVKHHTCAYLCVFMFTPQARSKISKHQNPTILFA